MTIKKRANFALFLIVILSASEGSHDKNVMNFYGTDL
jgi:hypothetical protein